MKPNGLKQNMRYYFYTLTVYIGMYFIHKIGTGKIKIRQEK